MKKRIMTSVTLLLLVVCGHGLHAQSYEQYAGRWRGSFTLQDTIQAPFVFEISKQGEVFFLNGEERLEGGRITVTRDSLLVSLDQFDNELAFKTEGSKLQGFFRRQDHSGSSIPVSAKKGNAPRFDIKQTAPIGNISGKYDVVFKTADGRDVNTVGVFNQKNSRLTGTFLRVSGDSRFLEGVVSGNRFYLSAFIGSSPSYFEGSFTADGTLQGMQAGTKTKQAFTGTRNDSAALPDAFTLTNLKPGYRTLDFRFPDMNGIPVSLKDEKYKNKVVILAITGSWCPNCADEAAFLAPWYIKNKNRGVEIVALHYERQSDTAYTRKVMRRFRQRFDIQYDQVFAGISNNDSVQASLPALNGFSSFPTTIFVDKQGAVSKVHTGYSGPATGKYYDEFVREFNEEVDKLLKQ